MDNSLAIKKISIKDKIGLVLILFIIIWFSLDAVRNRVSFIIISALYLLWLGIIVLKNPGFISRIINEILPLIFWTVLILLRTLIGEKKLTGELIYSITLIMIYIIFTYYRDKEKVYKKVIFYTIIICYTITGIITLYYLNMNSDLVRRSAAGLLNSSYYLNTFGSKVLMIGGWDYIYSLVGTTIVLLNVAIKDKNKYLLRNCKHKFAFAC